MSRYLSILCAVVVCGCAPPVSKVNQVVRNEVFIACLKALPAGPQSTQYNDWDEVVDACENAAYYQSLQIGPQPIKTPAQVTQGVER